jgi:cell division transport system permease protein
VRARFVLSEMALGLRRNLTMTIAVVLTVALSMAALGVFWLVHDQVNKTKSFWYGNIEVSVYLDKTVTQPERDAIRSELTSLPEVEHVYYESQLQAYNRAKELFKDTPSLIANLTPTTLPESYRVKLHDPKKYAIVGSAVSQMPGVDQVVDANGALNNIFRIADGLQRGALIVAIVVLVVAVLLIYNTVRLAAFSRRRETGIMRLVGASDLYIQAPFVLEGVAAAVVGAIWAGLFIALAKLAFIDHGLKSIAPHLTPYVGWGPVVVTGIWMAVLGVVLSALVSAATLQRYLRV